VLDALGLRPPLGLVGAQRGARVVRMARHGLVQRDRVFERELGARADRPVRAVRGVAEQHDVVVVPGPAAHHRELAPERAVGEQLRPLQLGGEDALDVGGGARLVLDLQPRRPERRVGRLHDERALALRVHVGVQVPDAVLVLAEAVGEARQRHARAEPDEAVGAHLDARAELGLQRVAHRAVDAVRPDDEVGVAVRGEPGILGLVAHVHAEPRGARLQDLQELQPAEAGEAVPRRLEGVPLVVDVDVVPVGEARRDVAVARLVGLAQVVQRLVREHDAEAEGVVRAVALDHLDARVRPALLGEDREVQAGGAAADHVDFHGVFLRRSLRGAILRRSAICFRPEMNRPSRRGGPSTTCGGRGAQEARRAHGIARAAPRVRGAILTLQMRRRERATRV